MSPCLVLFVTNWMELVYFCAVSYVMHGNLTLFVSSVVKGKRNIMRDFHCL